MHYRIDKKTKIVCTIGPSSQDKEMMKSLLMSGMTCMRMNFSHGTHEEHQKKIDTLREIEKEENLIIPICLDTKGPEIRTSKFVGGSAKFIEGNETRIYMGVEKDGTAEAFGVTYTGLYKDVHIGADIRLDDGNLLLKVKGKDAEKEEIICEVTNTHTCKDRRGVNVPGVHLTMPYLSEQDRSDLIFGCEQHVDLVSASFVRNVQDIQDMRSLLDSHGGKNIMIISKIENTEAIENLDAIIKESDGIMVARGDLAVEIPPEKVPHYQKYMIEACRKLGKPVITATQMLDSMIHNPFPTRAEVSDVAAAIDEGSDCVMLSGESANGDYPNEAVTMQAKIAKETEKHFDYKNANRFAYETSEKDVSDAISASVSDTALLINAKLIVTFSISGKTAVRISKTRPVCPVFVVSSNMDTLAHIMLYYGCYPYYTKNIPQFIEEMEVLALKIAKDYNLENGSKVIMTGGTPVGAGKTSFMKVLTVSDGHFIEQD